MVVANSSVDPANIAQALVYTLLDVFDATRDLYTTLRNKDKRDFEHNLRAKGYPKSRRVDRVDDDEIAGDESIVFDKAAVSREFDIGFQQIGPQFAIGDVITQTTLQAQIITLQSVLVSTFLYGPTSPEPISHHLSSLLAASRAAGTSSVDILAAQRQRQLLVPPPVQPNQSSTTRMATQPLPYPATEPSTSSRSTALVKTPRTGGDADETMARAPTIADLASRPRATRTDTESTTFSEPLSYGVESIPQTWYCLYALELQRHSTQALASSITSGSPPYCPHCNGILHLTPGRSWEIHKDYDGIERCFRIQNRFVVKCHRDSADGGYSCVLCSKSATTETVCGDVKALIRHIWRDHDVGEFELEEDIAEVITDAMERAILGRRRDSGTSFHSDSRGGSSSGRRSLSLGPNRRSGRMSNARIIQPQPRIEREIETLEIRSPRRSVG